MVEEPKFMTEELMAKFPFICSYCSKSFDKGIPIYFFLHDEDNGKSGKLCSSCAKHQERINNEASDVTV